MKVKILNETGFILPEVCIGKIVIGARYENGRNLIMVSAAELIKAGYVSLGLLPEEGLAFYEGLEVEIV